MVQLLENPERYDGRLVRVVGFLVLEFENNALDLARDAAEGD
jgi:hypothetical protein